MSVTLRFALIIGDAWLFTCATTVVFSGVTLSDKDEIAVCRNVREIVRR
jgi:hypothetical protein